MTVDRRIRPAWHPVRPAPSRSSPGRAAVRRKCGTPSRPGTPIRLPTTRGALRRAPDAAHGTASQPVAGTAPLAIPAAQSGRPARPGVSVLVSSSSRRPAAATYFSLKVVPLRPPGPATGTGRRMPTSSDRELRASTRDHLRLRHRRPRLPCRADRVDRGARRRRPSSCSTRRLPTAGDVRLMQITDAQGRALLSRRTSRTRAHVRRSGSAGAASRRSTTPDGTIAVVTRPVHRATSLRTLHDVSSPRSPSARRRCCSLPGQRVTVCGSACGRCTGSPGPRARSPPSCRPKAPAWIGGSPSGRAGNRGRPARRLDQYACWPPSRRSSPPGSPASSGCGSSSPTRRTNCARR